MHHLADSMTELCHGGEHDNAANVLQFLDSCIVVIGRGLNLSVSQGVDESGLPAVWHEVVSQRDCHKIKCDLV